MITSTDLRGSLDEATALVSTLEGRIKDAALAGKDTQKLAVDLAAARNRVDALEAALAEAGRFEAEDKTKRAREARARSTAEAGRVADEMAEAARALDAALIQVELAHEALQLKQMELRQALAVAGLADAGNRLHNTTGAGVRWAVWHHAPLLAKDLAIPNCPVHRRRSLAETVTTALPAIPREEAA